MFFVSISCHNYIKDYYQPCPKPSLHMVPSLTTARRATPKSNHPWSNGCTCFNSWSENRGEPLNHGYSMVIAQPVIARCRSSIAGETLTVPPPICQVHHRAGAIQAFGALQVVLGHGMGYKTVVCCKGFNHGHWFMMAGWWLIHHDQ